MYEIAVRGRLPDDWSHWFEGFTIGTTGSPAGPITVLVGPIVDQPQLHGVLARIRDLALPIEWVRRMSDGAPSEKTLSDREVANQERRSPNTPLDT
jgi:hypothetical protein